MLKPFGQDWSGGVLRMALAPIVLGIVFLWIHDSVRA
ncbi:MAG: hypothetical protein ACI82F_001953 [Planctomycetota bacterium]|jgi:hypothetical protein